MKNLLSIFIIGFFISSCGVQIEDTSGKKENSIGQIRSYSSQSFNGSDLTVLADLCNALQIKENLYRDEYVNSGTSLNFKNVEKRCESESTTESVVPLKLKNVSGTVQFVVDSESSARFFSEYETRNQGTISSFCNALASGGSVSSTEKLPGAAYADWYYVGNSYSLCGERDVACFIRERGFQVASGRYEIKQAEKIVVSTKYGSLNRGAVVYRESVSSFSCSSSEKTDFLGSTRQF